MKLQKRQQVAAGFFLTFLAGFIISWLIFGNRPEPAAPLSRPNPSQSVFQNQNLDFKTFFEVWKILKNDYINPAKLDMNKLMTSAVKGFVDGVEDPYTVYMDPKESIEFKENLNGQLEGIGALLEVKNGKLIVAGVIKSSPAERAGLKPNDIIYKIEEEEAAKMTLYEAVSKIRGRAGTKVKLIIMRGEKLKPFDVDITRGKIEIESVVLNEVKPGIFHIKINQFSDDTKDEFLKNINEILLKKPLGIILDLRGNGGGYLDIAVDMLSEFLPDKTPAVRIRTKNQIADETIETEKTPKLPNTPLVVLTDSGSASASEIVAGAIQDYKRGAVLGEKTFGKGNVQEIKDLEDGSSLRITTAKWLTPLGRDIDEIGIKPDIEVKFPENVLPDEDPQLEEAVEYLSTKYGVSSGS